jgi:hypothetical protein
MSEHGERAARAIQPLAAGELAKRLRDATPAILEALHGTPPVMRLDWRFQTRDYTVMEWNRAELGPSTEAVWTLAPADSGVEAVVRYESIRWSPVDVHHLEVMAHWRAGVRTASLFARGEGEAPVTEVRTDPVVWQSVWGMGLPLPIR